jgi:hypothetical protein
MNHEGQFPKASAAGHPNGVFRLSPAQLEQPTGAPVADGVQVA